MPERITGWLLRALSSLSLPVLHSLGACLGGCLAVLPTETRRITRINLSLCAPCLDSASKTTLLRRSLVETGKTMVEAGPLWHWERHHVLALVRDIKGQEHLETAVAQGRGAIIAAPHLGQWELIGLYCSARYTMTSLYRPPRLTTLAPTIKTARERFGARLVPATGGGVRTLYKALARGELVGILPDQEPRAGTGMFAPFCGQPAYTMVLLSRLAIRTGAPVLFAYAERLPRGRGFVLHFLPAPARLNQPPLEASMAVVNDMVARCIRRLPSQYQWTYKRFRRQPDGTSPYAGRHRWRRRIKRRLRALGLR